VQQQPAATQAPVPLVAPRVGLADSSSAFGVENHEQGVLLLSKGGLAALLARCPDASLRRRAHALLLQPRLAEAEVLMQRLAA
jgi:hypothetical protein